MEDESSRCYLFVTIDRATRRVFVQIKKTKTAANAKAFLETMNQVCPIRIQKILTDNGKAFTDRVCSSKKNTEDRQPTGEHEFDQLSQTLDIEH